MPYLWENRCLNHYSSMSERLREEEHAIKTRLKICTNNSRYEFLINKNSQFISKLKYQLKRTKKNKISKRKVELESNCNNTTCMNDQMWIKDLGLNNEHRRIIKSGEDLDDFIIYSAMSLLQKQFPLITFQSPAAYRANGYDYNPFQTI